MFFFLFFLFLAGPPRAPENVAYTFENETLRVTWVPLPIYFQAYLLQGYAVAAYKSNVMISKWPQPANATNASISGIKPDETDCVTVYAYNKYGDGDASPCPIIEEPGMSTSWLCRLNNALPRGKA